MIKKEKLHGIFSSKTRSYIGTGTTKKKTEQTTYWFAEERDNGTLEVQPINENYVPSGPKVTVEMEMFLDNYHPEPEIFLEKVVPNMNKLEKNIQLGESHRRNKERYSAEHEFQKAISIDELNVRANFGLGLTYLERGEISRAEDIFKRLVNIKACYEPQHKHLFNEYGIALRKHGMLAQALEYYGRAEKIVTEDENLYMNMARVHYEMGNLLECMYNLKKALTLNRAHEEACVFLKFLTYRNFIEECTVRSVIEAKQEDLDKLIKIKEVPEPGSARAKSEAGSSPKTWKLL